MKEIEEEIQGGTYAMNLQGLMWQLVPDLKTTEL